MFRRQCARQTNRDCSCSAKLQQTDILNSRTSTRMSPKPVTRNVTNDRGGVVQLAREKDYWRGLNKSEREGELRMIPKKHPTLAGFTFSDLFRPFCTFLHLFRPEKYASRTVSKVRHWKTTRNTLNKKTIGGIEFSSRNHP